MPRRSKHIAFLDADVLARAVTRTVLLVGAELSDYRPVWSDRVSAEADRHRRPNQARLRAFGWSAGPTGSGAERYTATDPKDRQVLADAVAANASFIVTGNVRDFGEADLLATHISAAHFDLFLSAQLSRRAYAEAVDVLASARGVPDEVVHAALNKAHPLTFRRRADAFAAEPVPTHDRHPAVSFRGARCLVCASDLDDPAVLEHGIGPECRDTSTALGVRGV